jgi:hypothetical protein
MTTPVKTPMVSMRPQDLMPGFDIHEPPDPAAYPLDPDAEHLGPGDAWDRDRTLWSQVKTYVLLHKLVQAEDAYEIPRPAMKWINGILDGGLARPLLMYGTIGVGKTWGACAAACFLSAFWDRQLYTDVPGVCFQIASDMVSELKDFSSEERREKMRVVTGTKVLVVDDLSRFKLTEYDLETVGKILDLREGKKLPTIVTLNEVTNPDVQLDSLLPPFLASRLLAGQQALILGEDRRRAAL